MLDLTVHNTGLAIGDKPRVTGVRINFRDRHLEEVNGANITVWSPYSPATGLVNGLALGLPATGARDISGIALGVIGAGADRSMTGIALGGIGVGAGGDMRGIMIGGIGAGGGGSMTGLSIGGIGVGGAGNMTGIQLGGIGVGSGANVTGISVGGVGVGSAGDVTGISIGGIGVGAGGRITGLSIGGVGVGAPRIKGIIIGGVGAGGEMVKAVSVTGVYFKIADRGRLDGASFSAVNNIRGLQHGLTIGLWNYAHELHGAQIGVINISDNGGSRRVLPLISVR